jgi:hypothetical protein
MLLAQKERTKVVVGGLGKFNVFREILEPSASGRKGPPIDQKQVIIVISQQSDEFPGR